MSGANNRSFTLRQHSPNVWEYQPQAVLEDANGGLGVYSGEHLRKIISDDPETKILFYDVFRSGDGKKLIGMQAGEFVDHFGEVRFRHAGGALQSRCAKEGRFRFIRGECKFSVSSFFVRWQVEAPSNAGETVELEIESETGKRAHLKVPSYPFHSWRKTKLLQQTIQKNYPFVWIRDHCLFYHRVHGVKRIVIYDNGSANYAELLDELVKMGERDLQILVVNWPFAMFRPSMPSVVSPLGTFYDTISQRAAYNHGFQILRHLSSYGTHFDLDEYLHIKSGKPLSKLIAKETRFLSYRIVKERLVPNVPEAGSEHPVRAAQFKYSYINPPARGYADKYVYRMGATLLGRRVACLDIHNVARVSDSALSHAMRLLVRKIFAYRRALLNRLSPSGGKRSDHKVDARSLLPPRFHTLLHTGLDRSNDDVVMYHYEGINTMWRRDLGAPSRGLRHQRGGPLEFNPAVHVKDLSVYKLLSAVGLTD